ncbi:putative signal transducing protein [Microbulbifer guangxiensis]|uniref:putative signal transducing protein n=1 Tax=Microbulbifer guangxiensis TaxID=2904249 RepID=UPI001F48EA54
MLIFTHENRLLVELARSKLEVAGIAVFLKNEYAQGATGELAPHQAWPELWLERDRDYERAMQLLRDAEGQADWICRHCGESNGAAFDYCWQCDSSRPPG